MKRMAVPVVAHLLVLAAFMSPGHASAQQLILDSGTPAGTAEPILSNSEWFAAEFSATAGEDVTQLSAYLTSMTGNGNTFAFDIYQDAGGGFLGARGTAPSSLIEVTATGTYTAPGWSTTSVNWVVPTTGDYWLAIEGNTAGTHNLPTFDVQQETSASTGTAPALAFAIYSSPQFKTTGAPPIGLQVTVAPVPEPGTYGLITEAGLLTFSVWTARRRMFFSAR